MNIEREVLPSKREGKEATSRRYAGFHSLSFAVELLLCCIAAVVWVVLQPVLQYISLLL